MRSSDVVFLILGVALAMALVVAWPVRASPHPATAVIEAPSEPIAPLFQCVGLEPAMEALQAVARANRWSLIMGVVDRGNGDQRLIALLGNVPLTYDFVDGCLVM